MIEPALPDNEKERLEELFSYEILDAMAEKDYDNYDEATNIHHRSINGQSKAWYRYFHKEYDMTQNAYLHINHADFYLKNNNQSQGIKSYGLVVNLLIYDYQSKIKDPESPST